MIVVFIDNFINCNIINYGIFYLGLNPAATLMSRRSVGRAIHSSFSKMKEGIRQQLQKGKPICTTADIWSTKHRSFIGVTAHWVSYYSVNLRTIS